MEREWTFSEMFLVALMASAFTRTSPATSMIRLACSSARSCVAAKPLRSSSRSWSWSLFSRCSARCSDSCCAWARSESAFSAAVLAVSWSTRRLSMAACSSSHRSAARPKSLDRASLRSACSRNAFKFLAFSWVARRSKLSLALLTTAFISLRNSSTAFAPADATWSNSERKLASCGSTAFRRVVATSICLLRASLISSSSLPCACAYSIKCASWAFARSWMMPSMRLASEAMEPCNRVSSSLRCLSNFSSSSAWRLVSSACCPTSSSCFLFCSASSPSFFLERPKKRDMLPSATAESPQGASPGRRG
mmetsp:Transcript_88360/g.245261  ORF Transcript_88360/g.245261 Transcript_88360/m.245261 type:complete len:308 (+) Transcript_88360:1544-2467(+)